MKKVNGTKGNDFKFHEIEVKLRSGVQLPERLFCLDKDSIVAKAIGDCTLSEIFEAPEIIQALIHQLSGERDRAIEVRDSMFTITQKMPKTSH